MFEGESCPFELVESSTEADASGYTAQNGLFAFANQRVSVRSLVAEAVRVKARATSACSSV